MRDWPGYTSAAGEEGGERGAAGADQAAPAEAELHHGAAPGLGGPAGGRKGRAQSSGRDWGHLQGREGLSLMS